jgi:2-polyprenyl-3-methyl-5-hydroxy-6-metoxy-1,4-benzoquinol methylase
MLDSQTEIRRGDRFAFGNNWRRFVALVNETRITAATESLTTALGTANLAGRSVLDVGCGSGLFSLAAHRLGARVHSFDFDLDSVAATTELRQRFAPDSHWTVESGSILDQRYVASLGQFDVVYSWGVLHHTGDLWSALRATLRLVAPGGRLYISIYNDQGFESQMWRRIKRSYNQSGSLKRGLLVGLSSAYLYRHVPVTRLARLVLRRGKAVAPPPRARGMSAKHDLVDWVGGYPFEVAKPEEVFAFVRRCGFELHYLKTCAGSIGCNEFVFERSA